MANQPTNRWFPPKTGALADHDVNDAHRRAFEAIYQLQDQLAAAHAKLAEHDGKITKATGTAEAAHKATSTINTKVNGLNVKAVPPTNGQTLKYNSATGQVEWS
jgi:hypothetical protein